MNSLKFSVDKIELIEEISNSQFARARVWAFASGNNRHGMPVSVAALKRAESSMFDKPLVWFYDKFTDDAEKHSKLEIPAGFVPRNNANISYEEMEDGRTFFCVDVLIWKYYSGKLLEIFEREDGEKKVSVEIQVLDKKELECGVTEIVDYCYMAITVLGEAYTEAIPMAKAQIVQFSIDKQEIENLLEFSQNTEDTILKEKEDEIMLFNKEEFATTFGLTMGQMSEMIYSACSTLKYSQGEGESASESTMYYMRDFCSKYAYCYSYKDNKMYAIPYAIENNQATLSFEEAKTCRMTYMVDETADGADELMSFVDQLVSEKTAEKETTFATESTELKNKVETLEAEKVEMSAKIESLETENNDLKTFKANVEETVKTEKVEFAIGAVREDLTIEQIDEWRNKVNEFSSIDEFDTAIKAFAYSVSKSKNKGDKVEFTRGHVQTTELHTDEPKGLWDRLNKK